MQKQTRIAGLMALMLSTGLEAQPFGREPVSLDLALAPHYASGSPNLDNKRHLVGGTGFLDLTLRGFGVSGRLQSQPQIAAVDDTTLRPEHRVRQAYVDFTGNHYDLRLGRQLILWGRADEFNPTDNITPTDFRFLTTENQGQRFGAIGGNLRWYLDASTNLELVVVPEFRSDRLPGELLPDDLDPVQQPVDDGALDSQVGLRLEHEGRGLDGSLSVYRGFSHTPGMTLEGSQLARLNPRMRVYGGDFVTTQGAWAVRGEAAYTDYRQDARFPDGVGPEDNLYLVAGVERQVLGDQLLQLQGLYRRLAEHTSVNALPPAERPAALFNDAAYSQFHETQTGATLSWSATLLRNTLDLELATAAYFQDFNYVLSGELQYRLNNRWTLSAAGIQFDGPETSNFGTLEQSSRLLLQLEYALF